MKRKQKFRVEEGHRESAGMQASSSSSVQRHTLLRLQRSVGNQGALRLLQRKCSCGGTCEKCSGEPKLPIGPANDQHEREADLTAARVMRMEDPSNPRLENARENQKLRRQEASVSAGLAPPIVHQVLRSSGQALSATARSYFEPRFGRDFSQVRIHADDRAGESARAVGANAYTVGHQIVFAPRKFQAETEAGRQLLAHELTHVVQQGGTLSAQSSTSRGGVLQKDEGGLPTGPRRVEVRLAVQGNCPHPEKIAEAIPGARTMLATAESWFIDYPFLDPHQQRLFDLILQAQFGSSSDDVRGKIHSRIIRMARLMDSATNGGVTFVCDPRTLDKCEKGPWSMFVRRGERNTMHVCPNFFTDGLEARRFTLIHESAHLAGVGDHVYLVTAGPIGLSECLASSGLKTEVALDNADSYSWMVMCLTRQGGFTIIPAVNVGGGKKP